jgi:hypothetical protein
MGFVRRVRRREAKALGCVGALRVCLRRWGAAVSVDVIEMSSGCHVVKMILTERGDTEDEGNGIRLRETLSWFYFADAECE